MPKKSSNTTQQEELGPRVSEKPQVLEIGENGASCHVGYKSCFYRKIKLEDNQNKAVLEDLGHKKVFDPEKVYGDAPNPTKL